MFFVISVISFVLNIFFFNIKGLALYVFINIYVFMHVDEFGYSRFWNIIIPKDVYFINHNKFILLGQLFGSIFSTVRYERIINESIRNNSILFIYDSLTMLGDYKDEL